MRHQSTVSPTPQSKTEHCYKCNGHGDIPSGYDRFASSLMAWRQCPACDGRGVVEAEPDAGESEAA